MRKRWNGSAISLVLNDRQAAGPSVWLTGPVVDARMNEMIEIIRGVLAGGMYAYHRRHDDFDPLKVCPVPTQPAPVYVGGHSDPALKRAARLADGRCSAGTDVATLRGLISKLNSFRRDTDRTHLPFEIQALCPEIVNREGFCRARDMGVTDAIVGPWGIYDADPLSISEKQDALRRFAGEIIHRF